MYDVISGILDRDEIVRARETLAENEFVDGRATAGWHARLVKNNLQATAGDQRVMALRDRLAGKIGDNPLFRLATRPKTITPLILSRYEPGMNYGSHVD